MTSIRKQRSSSLWALLGQDRGPQLKVDPQQKDVQDPVVNVRAIMERFSYACFLTLDSQRTKDAGDRLVILLFMLGALDLLCQVNGVEKRRSLTLFESMLKDVKYDLGGYSDENARKVLQGLVKATADKDGQFIMREGAESLRTWLIGEDIAAPHRLTELLNSQ